MNQTGERADQLRLPQQTEHNTEEQRTAFTVSIDAAPRFGVTTGISAQDRARTIQVAVDPAGKYLLVQIIETPVIRFVRVPLDGSP